MVGEITDCLRKCLTGVSYNNHPKNYKDALLRLREINLIANTALLKLAFNNYESDDADPPTRLGN